MISPRIYQERSYRRHTGTGRLTSFTVSIMETDLFISAEKDLHGEAVDAVLAARLPIESYIERTPSFLSSLTPLPPDPMAPEIIQNMLTAAQLAGVGPMAAVAGAVAEATGKKLLSYSREIIVENGGDIYLNCSDLVVSAILFDDLHGLPSLGVKIHPSAHGQSICTSSATIGHSQSFGAAEAVTVLSESACIADAAATALCNSIHSSADLTPGLRAAESIPGVSGAVIILNGRIGAWGDIELVSL